MKKRSEQNKWIINYKKEIILLLKSWSFCWNIIIYMIRVMIIIMIVIIIL